MSKKFSGVLGNLCSIGTLVFDAYYAPLLRDGTRECSSCGRKVRLLKNGKVARHVWELAHGSAEKPSENSTANRAARAFERTRGKR